MCCVTMADCREKRREINAFRRFSRQQDPGETPTVTAAVQLLTGQQSNGILAMRDKPTAGGEGVFPELFAGVNAPAVIRSARHAPAGGKEKRR